MRALGWALLLLAWSGASVAAGEGAEQAGVVKSVTGQATVTRGGMVLKPATHFRLYQGDLIETGPDGRLGLILDDDTVISLGSKSRFLLQGFQFQPGEKKLSLVARLYRGTLAFLSGQIAKLAPHRVQIETPHATLGVRGTHLLIEVD